MGFLSQSNLSNAIESLVGDGLNTTDTSSLVYFCALAKLLSQRKLEFVSLEKESPERESFINNVSDLIEIDEVHIWHPLKANGQEANWNKGKSVSAFVSSNLLTTAYGRQEKSYPKKNTILRFSDGEARLAPSYRESIENILVKYSTKVKFALCVWLLRTYQFDKTEIKANDLIDTIKAIYFVEIDLDANFCEKILDTSSQRPSSLKIVLDFANTKDKFKRSVVTSSESPVKCALSKPFLLLAGISGTGKTRFVREQAELTGSLAETYCLTSVRPDWHEPSDLLGYVSRLSGSAEFVVTDVLKFIAKAWREILDKGISLSVNEKLLCLQGGKSDIDVIKPYWLCLDEMNLAPVEQYFADYLSVLETRSWAWDEDDFQYSCDPLLKATTIQSIDNIDKLREELGFADYDDAWQHICEYGLSIPFNLIVAGTVNMDETTHSFSRKVIDRALSFDFGDFFPNDFDNFFAPTTINKALSYPIYSNASLDKFPKIDIDGRKSIAFINAINNVLAHTPFKLAYRALNELLLAVISSEPKEEVDLKAVWDDFLMCKVLPRIEGDTEKLAAVETVDISILKQLEEILKSEFGSFWNELPGSDKARPDLYRENVDGDKLIHIACRSKEKINWMEDRLTTFGFTSFWP